MILTNLFHSLMCSFKLPIMILCLDILGGNVHLFSQDLDGGQFWENKTSFGFHGAKIPLVGCQGAACQMREMTCMALMMTWMT